MGPNVFTGQSEAYAATIARLFFHRWTLSGVVALTRRFFFEQMYFKMSNGLRIANLIWYGTEEELMLTYSFANGRE
jgi:hypothetical protein